MAHPDGTAILCDCCPPGRRHKFAEVHNGVVVLRKRTKHDERHVAVLEPREVLTRLAGTFDGSAIRGFVDRVLA